MAAACTRGWEGLACTRDRTSLQPPSSPSRAWPTDMRIQEMRESKQQAHPTPASPLSHLADKYADEGQRQAPELVVPDQLIEVEAEQLKGQAQVVAEQEEVLQGRVGGVDGCDGGAGEWHRAGGWVGGWVSCREGSAEWLPVRGVAPAPLTALPVDCPGCPANGHFSAKTQTAGSAPASQHTP